MLEALKGLIMDTAGPFKPQGFLGWGLSDPEMKLLPENILGISTNLNNKNIMFGGILRP